MKFRPDPLNALRRFYKTVEVAPAEEGGWAVLLDGRRPRTPGGQKLALPNSALAALVADEWRAQDDLIISANMPATRLANTAIDHIERARATTIDGLVDYAGSDLVCYFAEGPRELVQRQDAAYGELLDWVGDVHGLAFERTAGILHHPQPEATLRTLRTQLEGLEVMDLTGVAWSAPLFGSIIIALAVRAGRITASEALNVSRLEEVFQEEQWGVDEEAAERTAILAKDAQTAALWFAALRQGDAA